MDYLSKLKIACAVTHVNEITLDLCLESIRKQTLPVSEVHVVSGVSPANKAFNECLDFALQRKADILVHLAADCILCPDAFDQILSRMDLAKHYAVTGRGFDMMNGENAPIGIWALNMRVIADRFRFRDKFKMDLDFSDRIESETGLTRTKSKLDHQLGYHHPIWLPQEMYRKFRYNAPKYRGKEIQKYLRFFESCLAINPNNSALKVGLMGLKRGAAEAHDIGGPLHDAFDAEWNELRESAGVSDGDFFAYHADFIPIGRKLLNSNLKIKPMAGNFFSEAAFSSKSSVAPLIAEPVGFRVRRAYRMGKVAAKDVLRPIYQRLPEPAKVVLRRIRGVQPVSQKARVKQVKREGLPLKNYGAINDGREDWRERWLKADKSKRVLLIAPKDFAGSMYKWTEALNLHTDIAARLVAFETHQYGYPVDLIVPECDAARLARFMDLVDEAGILHLKDEHSWFLGHEAYANVDALRTVFFGAEFASKPKVFTHYGGYARKFKNDSRYIEAVQQFDARIAMTPDINFEWFNGAYIPHTIDVDKHRFTWRDTKIFSHSPSSPEKKATYLFEETVSLLPRQLPSVWEGWSYDLISGVSFAECIRRKQCSSLFFDQAGRHRVADFGIDDVIGWYGNSAIEAMAHGIPTMAHLSDHAFARAAAAGIDLSDCPVINIERTRKSMMDEFVRFAMASPEERAELARRTRAFTEAFHGYEVCGTRLQEIYRTLSTYRLERLAS